MVVTEARSVGVVIPYSTIPFSALIELTLFENHENLAYGAARLTRIPYPTSCT